MAPPPSGVEGPVSVNPVQFSTPPPISDGSSPMEGPSRRPSRQVSKFRDIYCMVLPYCGTFKFEITEDFDYMDDCDTDDEEDTNHVANPRETLIKYVAQIRKSFGFDVDCVAPSWFNGIFVPFDMEEARLKHPDYYAGVLEGADYAIAEINSDLGGKIYELVKIDKFVRGRPWKKLYTLRVKKVDAANCDEVVDDDTKIIQALLYEDIGVGYSFFDLIQWRFKPVEEDAWYQPPPLEDKYPWLKPAAAPLDVAKDDAKDA